MSNKSIGLFNSSRDFIKNGLSMVASDESKKRAFDLAISIPLSLNPITIPLCLGIAVAIKIESPSEPIIFKQIRQGKNNKPFTLYKFRTLDNKGNPTKVGSFLRKHSLDEVLQLGNVIKGDMSMVSHRPRIYDNLETIPAVYRILTHKPGLTGSFQIAYGKGDVPHAHTELKKEQIKRQYETADASTEFSLKNELLHCFNTISLVIYGKKDRSLSSRQKNLTKNTGTTVETIQNVSCDVSANDSFQDSVESESTNRNLPKMVMEQSGFIDLSAPNHKPSEPPKNQNL